ncbi:hypothetical protein TrLO_g4306 [Triparma laevis f. longispina]|uniref:Uncharacterized protein n=1 Tax=Triparma laevis f. longispina TaxID=1714387 RepID=A0A9W7A0E5_9STRA|nr:hypothetical protein TrLO_g4306 [Triparma laevis f. longispina]
MPFTKSRKVADMSKTFNEDNFKQKCRRCQRALILVKEDFEKLSEKQGTRILESVRPMPTGTSTSFTRETNEAVWEKP